MAVAFRDGSNNLLYADTASGSGSQNDPFIWKHNDSNLAVSTGNTGDATASASTLSSTPTTTRPVAGTSKRTSRICFRFNPNKKVFKRKSKWATLKS